MKIDSLRESLRNEELESDATFSLNPQRGAGEENALITAAEAWPSIANQLSSEMRRGPYATWVLPLKAMTAKQYGGRVVFSVKAENKFAGEWVKSNLGARIRGLLEPIYNQPVELEIIAPT